METAHDIRRADEHRWLNVARAEVDQVGAGDLTVPDGFPEIPPARGDATSDVVGEYGRTWWRAYKLAVDLGREEDAKAFRSVAHRWYAIRDRG